MARHNRVRKRGRRWRWFAIGFLVAAGIRLAAIDGLLFPIRVTGGSMAETLLGDHFQIRCRDCELNFRFDADPPPDSAEVVCPNCGLSQEFEPSAQLHRGQRVVIDRAAFLLRSPRRGELIAIHDPADPGRRAVKRVVGLPGERIEIRAGDLLVDGELPPKTLAEQQRDAVLVYDDEHRASRPNAKAVRWLPGATTSDWTVSDHGFDYVPSPLSGQSSEPDWLLYHHLACYAGPAAGQPSAVMDDHPYNQGASRQLNPVHDLRLLCQIRILGQGGRVGFFIQSGAARYAAWMIDAGRQVVLERNGQRLISHTRSKGFQDQLLSIEYSLCDRRVVLAVDGAIVLDLDRCDDAASKSISSPLGIAAAESRMIVRQVRVYRDRYWLPPSGPSDRWISQRLQRDSWLVLGDNTAISVDSRNWAKAAVSRSEILGSVIPMEWLE